MADITMCEGEKCKLKEKCHRFTAKADGFRQSYFMNTPLNLDGSCNHFWNNKEYLIDYNENRKNKLYPIGE